MGRKKVNQVQEDSQDILPQDKDWKSAFKRGFLGFFFDKKNGELLGGVFVVGVVFGAVFGAVAYEELVKNGWGTALATKICTGFVATGVCVPAPLAAIIHGGRRAYEYWTKKEDFEISQNNEQLLRQLAEEKERNKQLEEAVQKLRKSMADEDREEVVQKAYQDGYYKAVADIQAKQKESLPEQQGTRFAAKDGNVSKTNPEAVGKMKLTLG